MFDPNHKYHNRADRDATWLVLLAIAVSFTVALPIAFFLGQDSVLFLTLLFSVGIGLSIGLTILTLYLISAKRKAPRGIKRVEDNINFLARQYKGTLYKDLKVNKENIDYLLVTKQGVFLILVRAYEGNISGMESDDQWRHSIAFKRQKSPIVNPIKELLNVYEEFKKGIDVEINPLVVLASGNRGYINTRYMYAPNEVIDLITPSDKVRYKDEELKPLIEKAIKLAK